MTTHALTRVGHQPAISREAETFDMAAMARTMWPPALLMGLMGVVGGVVVGIIQATLDDPIDVAQLAAWKPGLTFLGIGFVLVSITFLLATILGSLRDGGTQVQASLGESELILKRPWTGYVFPAAMLSGLMLLAFAFVYGFVAAAKVDTSPGGAADIVAWLAPLRLAGVAILLTGVAFGLFTIVKALRFQTDRITEIAANRQP